MYMLDEDKCIIPKKTEEAKILKQDMVQSRLSPKTMYRVRGKVTT